MLLSNVTSPTCVRCSNHHTYGDTIPMRGGGVTLHLGDYYCVVGKKYRKLKKRAARAGVPTDCPKLKTPPLLRIYCFKDSAAEFYEKLFSSSRPPSAHAYAMRFQGASPLSAWMLRDALEQGENPLEPLLSMDEVLEIDDGFCPYFFHKTADGLLLCLFDREAALKNKLTQNIQPKRSDEKND